MIPGRAKCWEGVGVFDTCASSFFLRFRTTMWKASAGHQVKIEDANGNDDDWETDPDFVVSDSAAATGKIQWPHPGSKVGRTCFRNCEVFSEYNKPTCISDKLLWGWKGTFFNLKLVVTFSWCWMCFARRTT